MGSGGVGRGVAIGGGGGGVAGGGGAGGGVGVTDFGTTIFSGRPKKSMAPHATLAESTEARRKGESFMAAWRGMPFFQRSQVAGCK